MRALLRRWRLLVLLLVVAAIVVVAMRPRPVAVDVAAITRGPMRVTIDEEGETRLHERFSISAPVSGHVMRIDWEPGDKVERGKSVLARIRPVEPALIDARSHAELTGAVESARSALGQARAQREEAATALERLSSTLKRQEALIGVGAVSQDEVEQAQIRVREAEEARRAAEFNVARAESDLQSAKARLQKPASGDRIVTITSPIDGVVLKRYRESAAVVAAGEPLLEVGDPARLEVVSDFLSTDAVRVSPGNRVLIEQWGGGRELTGRVRLTEPSGFMKVSALGVEEQRVNVIIDFDDVRAATAALGDAYRVEVRVIVWEQPSVVRVPVGALFRRGTDWAIFVVEEGRARARRVAIEHQNGVDAEVINGVAPGTPVVVHAPDTLQDGMRVSLRTS